MTAVTTELEIAMPGKIIVGYESRENGPDAVTLGDRLRSGLHDELLACSIYPDFHSVVGWHDDASAASLHDEAVARLADVPGLLHGQESGVRLLALAASSPAAGLQHIAEQEQADLIVVGSCHRGALGRLTLGSVTAAVIHGAPCGVAIAPRGYALQTHADAKPIGIAYDGSPESCAALDAAATVAKATARPLHLITVVPPVPGQMFGYLAIAYVPGDYGELADEAAQQLAADAAARIDAVVRIEICHGAIGTQLIERSRDLEVLFVGSRNFGPVSRVVMGSTSTELTLKAHCPIVVLPRPVARTLGYDRETVTAATSS